MLKFRASKKCIPGNVLVPPILSLSLSPPLSLEIILIFLLDKFVGCKGHLPLSPAPGCDPLWGLHLHSGDHTYTLKGVNMCVFSEEREKHPKTQQTQKRRKLTVPKICLFGCVCVCVAFSGALCSSLRGRQNTPENTAHPKSQIL